jgi:tRNA1Val (adenine37-N6)-methyltransferase
MSNSHFTFKKFKIEQEGCAMKVGTDGCLLGAWFCTDNCTSILDIGAGTGLISIMAAQRSSAQITGIELDSTAAKQACKNAETSPWGNRITIINADILNYNPGKKFDSIVSNPPYFINSLKCDDQQRTLARHSDSLTPSAFFAKAKDLLHEGGKISIIIPLEIFGEWEQEAAYKGFSVQRATRIHTTPRKAAKRILVEFAAKVCTTPFIDDLILETSPGEYSPEAKNLLREFYLKIE